ncbi:MAG TPA: A24 family peptidase [Ilumatobacteraceae bacterium]|nr:A24 family peptidase [Ilumatobacteraceae bacterium]
MDQDPDGIRGPERALWFVHDVGGDVTAEEETGLAEPLIPDRTIVRSNTTGWSGVPLGACTTRRRALIGCAAVAVIVLAVAAAVGASPLAGAIGIALLFPAAVVDVEQRRLPDTWVVAAMVAMTTTLAASSAVGGANFGGTTVVDMAGGAIAMAVPVLVLHLVSPASMGFGDVKAATVLGAAVGTVDGRLGAVALCIAAAVGATVGLAARQRTIPFGPFLVTSAWFVLLAHDPIADALFTGGVGS